MTGETTSPERPRRTRKAAAEAPAAMAGPAAQGPTTAPAGAPEIDEDDDEIVAEVVEIHQGAVGRVEAGELTVTIGAVGAARAERIDIERGMLGAALADEVEITQSMVQTVVAREVGLEQVYARAVIAAEVTVEKPSFIGVLLAWKVTGDVRPLLDWRGALALGGIAAVAALIFGRGRRDA